MKKNLPAALWVAAIHVLLAAASAKFCHHDVEFMNHIVPSMQSGMELALTHATQEADGLQAGRQLLVRV